MRLGFLIVLTFLFSIGDAQVLPLNRYYNPDFMGGFVWDNISSNGQVNNGNGNWDNTTVNWLASPPTGLNVLWSANRTAVFGGDPGVGAAGTVSVVGTQSVKSLIFQTTPSGNFLIQNGNLSLTGGVITTYQDATISSTLDGGGNFIKTGNANLILTGTSNLFSGNITVSQGGLYLGTSTAAGTTAIDLGDDNTGSSNIEWRWAGNFTPSNNITVNNKGTGTVLLGAYSTGLFTVHSGNIQLNRSVVFYDNSLDRSTFTGLISGNPGTITIDGNGTWDPITGMIARITFENNSNSFTANIIINAQKAFQMGQGIPSSIVNVVNSNSIEVNGSLILHTGANSTGRIGAMSGASSGICEIHSTITGPQTLSVGHNNGSATFNGNVRNGLGGQVMNFEKAGIGAQLLNGTNTYTGTTVINAGRLGGVGTLSNTASTTVNSGAAISGGTGTGSAGIFNVRNLIFATGTNAAIDVFSNGTNLSRVAVTGTCALGTISKINLLQAMPAGTFDIITSTGAMTGTVPTIGTNSSGRTVSSITVIGGNTLRIVLI